MSNAISATNNAASNFGTAAPKTALSDATASQDRFLKLLVAQLNNQDPMNPMDNAQMTSQMAQINTVSGITTLNESVKSLSQKFTSMQMVQSTGLIGHDVLVESNTLAVRDGKAQGAIDIAANADKVEVQILSPGGQLLDTVKLGARASGRHDFSWDASQYKDAGAPRFQVVASSGGKTLPSTALARDHIVGLSSSASGLQMELKGRGVVAYDSVQTIL